MEGHPFEEERRTKRGTLRFLEGKEEEASARFSSFSSHTLKANQVRHREKFHTSKILFILPPLDSLRRNLMIERFYLRKHCSVESQRSIFSLPLTVCLFFWKEIASLSSLDMTFHSEDVLKVHS